MAEASEYMTVKEAADLLRISRDAAYNAVKAGQIPHIRLGKTIRIPRAELVANAGR